MQKKNDNIDNIIDKFVKKDYNDELEKALEKKTFDENTKSTLLNILYKIETAYKDYKQVKQNVENKESLIENIIEDIKNNCNEMILVNPYSEESKIIGKRTFLVEKAKKRIICYNIERKLLYSIAKISKKDTIIKTKNPIIDYTLSNLINTGNNINTVEPLRDFNGYSWTTLPKEIESINHNMIYQNLIILVGNDFLNRWVKNNEIMIDYMEKFQNILEENYGKENAKNFIDKLKEISIFIELKYDAKSREKLTKYKTDIEEKLEKMVDNEKFIENVTNEKRNLTAQIKQIDETINNKELLQKEYKIRNEKLPLEEKIFSMRILSQLMVEERKQKLDEIEKLNVLLTPKKYIKIKRQLEDQEKYLKLLDIKDIDKEIEKLQIEIQKIFLKCFEQKIEKCNSKSEMTKLIYEFRYYSMLPYNYNESIFEEEKLSKEVKEVGIKTLEKAHKLKVVERFSKQTEVDYELLKYLFENRNIKIEDIQIKLIKEKNNYTLQVFDGNLAGEKRPLETANILIKKDLAIRFNKKVKAFY